MYAPTLLRGWCVHLIPLSSQPNLHPYSYRVVYTPTQIINFALVPPQFRYVFVSVVSLFWSTFSVSLRCRADSLRR
jgi:hypothetical protein